MKLILEATKKEKHILYIIVCTIFIALNMVGGIIIGVEVFKDHQSLLYNLTLFYTVASTMFYWYVMFTRNTTIK